MPATFTARFSTTCIRCGNAINPGDSITWNRRGEKGSSHAACAPSDLFAAPAPERQEPATPRPAPVRQPAPAPPPTDALGAMLAALVQPHMQEHADELDALRAEVRKRLNRA
jgi:hypothetical protein